MEGVVLPAMTEPTLQPIFAFNVWAEGVATDADGNVLNPDGTPATNQNEE